MQAFSRFNDTRRSRRRRSLWRATGLTILLGSLAAAGFAGHRIGVSQARTETDRLEHDVADLRERNRVLSARAARAEQQAEAATARYAELQRTFETERPQGELRDLLDLAIQRLQAGVPASRLAFVLREARVERRCGRELEARPLAVHTPMTTNPLASADFAGGRILVSAQGAPTRDPEGKAQTDYDPGQPVTLRFLKIDGEVATAVGPLPLAHALVLGGEEFQFMARPGERPGEITITSQRCASP